MILTQDEIQRLEEFTGQSCGYFGAMVRFLDGLIAKGVQEGRFTQDEVREDLDIALWYSYAWNNLGGYPLYWKTAQWMPASEKNARGCGSWYYRYAVSLLYCGEPQRALEYHQQGIREEPGYPWNWLQLGKLRAHFGDRAGALAAADQGLALVPGDHEFLTLRREIQEGRTLPEMENHFIDPQYDQDLQAQRFEDESDRRDALQKLWNTAGILLDPEGLEQNKALLRPVSWGLEDPEGFLRAVIRSGETEFVLRFPINEAAFSHLDPKWISGLRSWMDKTQFATYTTYQTYFLAEYLVNLDGRARGVFQNPETGAKYIDCASDQPVPPPPVWKG